MADIIEQQQAILKLLGSQLAAKIQGRIDDESPNYPNQTDT